MHSKPYQQDFACQALEIYNAPISPHLEILSIDDWGSDCANDPNFNCTNCAWDATVFAPLYAMGWKGIGVLNGVPPYFPTCGWTTYREFDIQKSNWEINATFLNEAKADVTNQRILLYDPDFSGQAEALQSTCASNSTSGGITTYQGCDEVGDAVTYAAANQAAYGYTYVYPVEQTFWDTTRMHLSNGSSIYSVMLNLMNTYNPSGSSTATTTASSTTRSSSSSMTHTVSSSQSSSDTRTDSTSSATSSDHSSTADSSSTLSQLAPSSTFSSSPSNSALLSTAIVTTSAGVSNSSAGNVSNSMDAAKIHAVAATMGAGAGAMVFLGGLFPLSYILSKQGKRVSLRRSRRK